MYVAPSGRGSQWPPSWRLVKVRGCPPARHDHACSLAPSAQSRAPAQRTQLTLPYPCAHLNCQASGFIAAVHENPEKHVLEHSYHSTSPCSRACRKAPNECLQELQLRSTGARSSCSSSAVRCAFALPSRASPASACFLAALPSVLARIAQPGLYSPVWRPPAWCPNPRPNALISNPWW